MTIKNATNESTLSNPNPDSSRQGEITTFAPDIEDLLLDVEYTIKDRLTLYTG